MGSNADSDVTGMTLQALAPYYHKAGYENVTAAIDRGLARLSEMQNDSGGYSTAILKLKFEPATAAKSPSGKYTGMKGNAR